MKYVVTGLMKPILTSVHENIEERLMFQTIIKRIILKLIFTNFFLILFHYIYNFLNLKQNSHNTSYFFLTEFQYNYFDFLTITSPVGLTLTLTFSASSPSTTFESLGFLTICLGTFTVFGFAEKKIN